MLLSLLAVIPCAIIGTYIVVKRISLITGSISHATFGGLGIAYFFGFDPFLGGALFGVFSGASIGVLQTKAQKRLDTLLSFLWAFGMAIGLIFVYATPGYSTELFTYLFGNIFLISDRQLLNLVGINIVIIIVIGLTFNTVKTVLFDEEFAEVRGLPIMATYLIFYILVGLTIIVILSIIGVIMLIAFLTLPAAIALFYQKTIKRTMIMAGLILSFSNLAGLFIAHWVRLPPSPIIVLILSLLYLISLGYDAYRRRKKMDSRNIVPHACQLELDSFGVFQEYIAMPSDVNPQQQPKDEESQKDSALQKKARKNEEKNEVL